MRPGQNKRMRGRNNNRKGPNPLTRSYESNGPDVKIRGTAHHVAEKYLQLARDAQSSGDPVAAESYLQHAEHYFRLIASAQQAQMGFARTPEEAEIEEGDEDDLNALPDRFASPPERAPPAFNQQQSSPERQPYNGDRQPYNGERPHFNGERPQSQERHDRSGYDRQQRGDRPVVGRGPRPYRDQDHRQDNRGQDNRGQDNRGQDNRGQENRNQESRGQDYRNGAFREGGRDNSRDPCPREQPGRDQSGPGELAGREQPERDSYAEAARQPEPALRQADPVQDQAPDLPAFITAPVRVTTPLGEPTGVAPDATDHEALADTAVDDGARFPRRRRRARPAVAVVEDGTMPSDVPSGGD